MVLFEAECVIFYPTWIHLCGLTAQPVELFQKTVFFIYILYRTKSMFVLTSNCCFEWLQWSGNYFWTGEAKPETPNWWDLYRIWTAFLSQK